MSDEGTQHPLGDRYGLGGARDLGEYTQALTRLMERGRREQWVTVLSEAEAYTAAELLGQFAQLEPLGELNQLAASLASRIYRRLGA
ncbi:hypothetical protein [Amycolatopsis sp. FDAARGOS 1241]|uniref:hypothetical protein n=1 Tax=Amycolatopsis sp. FDAARGOS 1241 TaxID=2778070 RepID=UPI00194FEDB2|nr:hypothetical protein [Amycolatopsis sp. FDAARGOS 1241]QRP42884.1 hypothetical protein I6J71_25815 [Amycolatopsis sp. FDAARGOS 1241]QRP43002.1 hypothetical protein I6J71_26555 [Amycolatopsis sp. FDAARGOS 1241]